MPLTAALFQQVKSEPSIMSFGPYSRLFLFSTDDALPTNQPSHAHPWRLVTNTQATNQPAANPRIFTHLIELIVNDSFLPPLLLLLLLLPSLAATTDAIIHKYNRACSSSVI